MSLKKLFKKKPGGTLFGNVLRGVTKIAASTGVFPGAGLVAKLLPDAPPLVRQTAEQLVGSAVNSPVFDKLEIKDFASMAKNSLLAAGASAEEASKIGAVVHTAGQLPPAQSVEVLRTAEQQVATNNFLSKEEVKSVLNGAMDGARDGAVSTYLDKTKAGQEQYKAAVNAKGKEIMPWVLGVIIGILGLLLITKK